MPQKTSQGLPDHIQLDVQILFVGINPGLRSAAVGHHYAGHSNRFWKLLFESQYIPLPLTYQNDWRLPEWGYGLTNIVARPTSGMHDLTPLDYTKGRITLLRKVCRYQPQVIALLGITVRNALRASTPKARTGEKKVNSHPRVGFQEDTFGGARVFVLPNPSGRNAHYSFHDMLELFLQLRSLSQTI